jgi:hypothetical protein
VSDRLRIIRYGPAVIALGVVGAAAGERADIFRVEPHCLGIVRDGAVVVSINKITTNTVEIAPIRI